MKITRPTLLLNKKKCLSNIEKMANKARAHNLRFRPHFKTHQSAEIGNWFRDFGVECIAVSSVDMAVYFANNGWNDITVAFPYNIHETDKVNELAQKIKLNLLILDPGTVKFLDNNLTSEAGVYIKIDTGYHRTGVPVGNIRAIDNILDELTRSDKLTFMGFLSHTGNSYTARSKIQVKLIHDQALESLGILKENYVGGRQDPEISIGDTPCCSVSENFYGINEIRPGNFVFYDAFQYNLGICSAGQVAVAMTCPVVAKHKERNEIVIYGGAVHFSKDRFLNPDGSENYGLVIDLKEDGWSEPVEGVYLRSLSQEHGVISATSEYFNSVSVGDIIGVLPVHSCLTANLMKRYLTLNDKYIEMMR